MSHAALMPSFDDGFDDDRSQIFEPPTIAMYGPKRGSRFSDHHARGTVSIQTSSGRFRSVMSAFSFLAEAFRASWRG